VWRKDEGDEEKVQREARRINSLCGYFCLYQYIYKHFNFPNGYPHVYEKPSFQSNFFEFGDIMKFKALSPSTSHHPVLP
jgi:hypothetical protein